jgi:hypothetical protein
VKKADVNYLEGYTGQQNDFWVCETDAADEPDGQANKIYMLNDLPNDFLHTHQKTLNNGQSRICIPHAKANRTTFKVDVPKGAPPPMYLGERHDDELGAITSPGSPGHHRQLMRTSGTHTVLAVIISSSKTGERDNATNATILAGNLFGTGPLAQNTNVISQYHACSNGQLTLKPYTSKYVSDGIISVTIPVAIKGSQTLTTIQNAAIKATLSALQVSDIRAAATHVLFCLPQGT